MAIGLWVVLATLTFTAGVRGEMPGWVKVAAALLVPLAAAASIQTVALLADHPDPLWPVVVPTLAPLLVILSAVWALYPSLRTFLPSGTLNGVVWGVVFLLGIIPWPQRASRNRAAEIRRIKVEIVSAGEQSKDLDEKRNANLSKFEKLN